MFLCLCTPQAISPPFPCLTNSRQISQGSARKQDIKANCGQSVSHRHENLPLPPSQDCTKLSSYAIFCLILSHIYWCLTTASTVRRHQLGSAGDHQNEISTFQSTRNLPNTKEKRTIHPILFWCLPKQFKMSQVSTTKIMSHVRLLTNCSTNQSPITRTMNYELIVSANSMENPITS